MAIGYGRARNLMRQLGWNMRVTTLGDSVEKIEVFHLGQQKEHTFRLDCGRKLMREWVMCHRRDSRTAILEYNRVEAEVEADTHEWFAITRWAPVDAMAAAEEQGVALTEEQAVAWWKRNERLFQDLLVEEGNKILLNMNFEEGE